MAVNFNQPISFMQMDPRWSSISYSVPGENTNIGRAGCGPTCAAMVISSLKDRSVTPATTAAWSLQHGYKALKQGTYYSYIVPQLAAYGIQAKQINSSNIYKKTDAVAMTAHKAINKALQRGNWIIACMGKGNWTSSGHYVLAWRTDGSHVWINDPASTKAGRIYNTLEFWESQIKYAWEITVPQDPKEEDDEMVENKRMAILGKDINVPTIFKDGVNYVSFRGLCEALGLTVSSSGSTPIAIMNTLQMQIKGQRKVLSGMNAAGTTYTGVRALAEALGYKVSWDDANKVVVIE